MKEYLKDKAIVESGPIMRVAATTPARKSLFDVLTMEMIYFVVSKRLSLCFHSIVAMLLYVAPIRARMDILLAVGFLCTRVSKRSTTQDQAKFKSLLKYIRVSMDLEYTLLGAEDMGRMRSWQVDAS